MSKSTNAHTTKSTTPEAEVLVRVEGVSKKFCKDLKRSLWYGIQDITSELFGLKKKEGLRKDEFWAVSEVSFELKRGECLGLIGHNGAGKSTLLKILNGLIKPDKGKITMKGRIASLIELGAGFNPILTGRENVFNNGAVLGFTQKEIAAKYQDIVEFAELGEFMDTPVQNYSSGMKVRLGFAVAAQMEPDVLIIDEVLAVGDVGFRNKCINRIVELISKAAVIFVSHSMPAIGRISTDVLFFRKGKLVLLTQNLQEAVAAYYNEFEENGNKLNVSGDNVIVELDKLFFNDIVVYNGKTNEKNIVVPQIQYGENIRIKTMLRLNIEMLNLGMGIVFIDKEQKIVGYDNNYKLFDQSGVISIEFYIPNQFVDGFYNINIVFSEELQNKKTKTLTRYGNIINFQSIGCSEITVSPIKFLGNWV